MARSTEGIGAETDQVCTLTILNQNCMFQAFAVYPVFPQSPGLPEDNVSIVLCLGVAAPGSPDNPSQAQLKWTMDDPALIHFPTQKGSPENTHRLNTRSGAAARTDPNHEYTTKIYVAAGNFTPGQVVLVGSIPGALEIQYDSERDRTVTYTPQNAFVLST